MRQEVLRHCHDELSGGHLGVAKTLARVERRYWWSGITVDVKDYVTSCRVCQFQKIEPGAPRGYLSPLPIPRRPFQIVGIDHLGPFPRSVRGNSYILVVIDYLTRWIVAAAVPNTSTEPVVEVLENEVLCKYGAVERLISDRGSAFTSHRFAAIMDKWRVRHTLATTEHPQTNGLCERANRTPVGKTTKLLPRYTGPYQVVRRVCPTTYLVEDIPARRRRRRWTRFNAHVSQLRLFRTREGARRKRLDSTPIHIPIEATGSHEGDPPAPDSEVPSAPTDAKPQLPCTDIVDPVAAPLGASHTDRDSTQPDPRSIHGSEEIGGAERLGLAARPKRIIRKPSRYL